jgi:predicted Ser/Thr protein kinase
MFPQLQILSFLGKGGMGAVYQARQLVLDRIVALKILPPQVAGGTGFAERFNREARALARLNHPNIVAVYEFGQVNGLPFFVMEFVDGLNLRQLEQAGKLSPREALQIVPQICEALQFAHDEGVVHRDIKPENILVDKKGRVKIADFGIAKILGAERGATLTETRGAIGTPHYMAPEQVENPAAVDHRADIFSLGVVFYEMLTGELPLGKFSPPSSRKVEVDVRLDDVVLRALEKDPERRYQHASQVKTAVDTISTSAGAPPPLEGGPALAQAILERDYSLDIKSCLRRGWKLLWGNFWPLAGASFIILALLGFASMIGGVAGPGNGRGAPVVALLALGPLMGGLFSFYLKKIRGQPATIETAFSGFGPRFPQLLLGGLVAGLLTALGFMCFALPGLYLAVAWWFTLILIVDKQLEFWPAMEVSRKVVTRHWWKFFGFWLLAWLLSLAGALALVVGLFISLPFVLIAVAYAYEDVFGSQALPATATILIRPAREWKWRWNRRETAAMSVLVAAVVMAFLVIAFEANRIRRDRIMAQEYEPPVTQPVGVVDQPAAADTGSSRETLQTRMDAATAITSPEARSKAMTTLAADAAKAGEWVLARTALSQINSVDQQNQTASEVAHLLAQRGLRKQAVEIAKTIGDLTLRDSTLSDLAQ